MGVSAGGLKALGAILPCLDQQMRLPVLIVQHLSPHSDDFLADYFGRRCSRAVQMAEDKDMIQADTIYFAPANYHLMVEQDRTLALSTAERVQYSRPSVDVLFETAAEVFLDRLVGVILTGANADGTRGAARIRELSGLVIAQSPETAEADAMPLSAIENAGVDHILPLNDIAPFINRLTAKGDR